MHQPCYQNYTLAVLNSLPRAGTSCAIPNTRQATRITPANNHKTVCPPPYPISGDILYALVTLAISNACISSYFTPSICTSHSIKHFVVGSKTDKAENRREVLLVKDGITPRTIAYSQNSPRYNVNKYTALTSIGIQYTTLQHFPNRM